MTKLRFAPSDEAIEITAEVSATHGDAAIKAMLVAQEAAQLRGDGWIPNNGAQVCAVLEASAS